MNSMKILSGEEKKFSKRIGMDSLLRGSIILQGKQHPHFTCGIFVLGGLLDTGTNLCLVDNWYLCQPRLLPCFKYSENLRLPPLNTLMRAIIRYDECGLGWRLNSSQSHILVFSNFVSWFTNLNLNRGRTFFFFGSKIETSTSTTNHIT